MSTAAGTAKKPARAPKRGGARKKAQIKKRRIRALLLTAGGIGCLTLLAALSFVLNERLERRTYSLAHGALIVNESAAFGLDPSLVAAVIHCESSGRADARSPKGAVGLMQIMPATGQWIAEKLEMADYREAMLEEPEVNVRMGCWYLAYLLEKFDGNTELALAAYNAGPGNVGKWLADPAYSEGGKLTVIPFAETETYVKRVSAAQKKYMELYEEELG